MTVATNNHILIDDKGIARIDGTRMKVIHLAGAMIAYGFSPEQLLEQFPDLSLAQIHAALSHYYDHKAQFDAQLQSETEEFERDRATVGPSPVREKLRASGLLP